MTVPDLLRKHFDRIAVIYLHRIGAFLSHWGSLSEGFCLDYLHKFPAIDARHIKPPSYWKDEIPALWACGESHRQVIARALSDGVKTILIMEDDCIFTPDAEEILPQFLAEIPADWDGLMLGGQVSVFDGKTTPISEYVSRCVQVERLHCYALSRRGMQTFHDVLCEPTNIANDYRWGDAQEDGRLTVYRCEPFIAYQADGKSAISERVEPARIWDHRVDVRIRNPDTIPIVSLVCPFDVMCRLRKAGLISNGGESAPQFATLKVGREEQGELQIAGMMLETFKTDTKQAAWIVRQLRNDTAFHRHAIFALWHPSEAIPYPDAAEIRASTYEEAETAIKSLWVLPVSAPPE